MTRWFVTEPGTVTLDRDDRTARFYVAATWRVPDEWIAVLSDGIVRLRYNGRCDADERRVA